LEGGVQRAGDNIRVNVQLIDARTDDHLWSEIYDRQMSATNIFTIQTEIAEAIAEALKTTLSPSERKRIRLVPTDNLEAYEAYLIGRQRLAMRTIESLSESIDYFRQAVELDPRFALAWAGLADACQLHHFYAGLPNREEMYAKVEAILQTALELDKDLAEAHASLGLLRYGQDQLEEAEQSFKRALELNPNYPPASLWYGMLLKDLARYDEALARTAAAVELDPMSPIIRVSYAQSLRLAGRIEEALEELETVLEIDPDFVAAHDQIATIQWQVFNRLDKAARGYVKMITLDPERSSSYVWLGQLYLDLGAPDRASQLFDRASELAADGTATVWGRLLLQLFRGGPEPILEDVEATRADFGKTTWLSQVSVVGLRNQAMAGGRYSEALAIYSRWYPQLLAEREPDIGLGNYRAAIDLALVLQKKGDLERAAMLLEGAFAFVRTQRRLGWWAGYWISDVQILALQGRRSEALAALGLAADEGWRSLWWYYLQHDPNLDTIRGEPEFQAVLAEIEADVADQMQRVREMERNGEIMPVPGVVFEPK
jgi:tetratricopeptide (TPR) repeat protein